MTHTFVDLFCGAGGLSLGFHQAGFRSVLAVDHDEHAIATYKANFGAHASHEDLRLIKHFPESELVVGGPPCQGFSRLGKQAKAVSRLQLNSLWREYFRCVREVNAKVFLIENVPNITRSVEFREICHAAEELGYRYIWAVLNAADYGVPQRRHRWFLLASRIGQPWLPPPTHRQPGTLVGLHLPVWRTVRDAIGDLALEPTNVNRHNQRNVGSLSLERYKHVPPGGNRKDLPDHLSMPCWLNKNPASGGSTDLMGRLRWDAPSLTIRTEFQKPEKGCYLHPEADRSLTVREGARLQTFPDDFEFVGSNFQAARQIGNAVPPLLARRIAEAVRIQLEDSQDIPRDAVRTVFIADDRLRV